MFVFKVMLRYSFFHWIYKSSLAYFTHMSNEDRQLILRTEI